MLKKILVVLFLAAAYLGISYLLQPKLREVLRAPQTPPAAQNEASGPAKSVETPTVGYDCVKDQTPLSLLEGKVGTKNVELKTFSFGKMVDAISGVKGGEGGKYWIYFVDGKSATVGADAYKCLDSEKIEWRFVKPE